MAKSAHKTLRLLVSKRMKLVKGGVPIYGFKEKHKDAFNRMKQVIEVIHEKDRELRRNSSQKILVASESPVADRNVKGPALSKIEEMA